MKVSYRTITEIWGSFEAPVIAVKRTEHPHTVQLVGAESKKHIKIGKFTNFVGDAVEYAVS